MNRRKRVYVASSWRNELQPFVVQLINSFNLVAYDFRNPEKDNHGFHWSEVDPNWEHWTPKYYRDCLNNSPIAESGFNMDFRAMQWADICVLVLPCGRSAHLEAGWMKGAGKKVYAFIQHPFPFEPELMYKLLDGIATTPEELIRMID